jgi:hypothetical protein
VDNDNNGHPSGRRVLTLQQIIDGARISDVAAAAEYASSHAFLRRLLGEEHVLKALSGQCVSTVLL